MIEVEQQGKVGIVTLARPAARNALTAQMMQDLFRSVQELDASSDVNVIVVTGQDPAFCAGLDLKDLATTYKDIRLSAEGSTQQHGLLPRTSKPIIGAINGAAVTGGLEVALGCDWLIASEKASFADTHARVGVMPGGGMTIRLPQLVGINRARQMSFTGNFIDAKTAYQWGLVNEVCEHDSLMTRVIEQAKTIAEIDPLSVREIRTMYETLGNRSDDDAYLEEAKWSRRWMKERFDAATFESKRDGIISRGSSQQ